MFERFKFKRRFGSPIAGIKIIRTDTYSVYLHKISTSDLYDGFKDPHDHGCDFLSIGLFGTYTEELFDDPLNSREFRTIDRGPFQAHFMKNSQAHLVTKFSRKNVYTLYITYNFAHRPPWIYLPSGPVPIYEAAKLLKPLNQDGVVE